MFIFVTTGAKIRSAVLRLQTVNLLCWSCTLYPHTLILIWSNGGCLISNQSHFFYFRNSFAPIILSLMNYRVERGIPVRLSCNQTLFNVVCVQLCTDWEIACGPMIEIQIPVIPVVRYCIKYHRLEHTYLFIVGTETGIETWYQHNKTKVVACSMYINRMCRYFVFNSINHKSGQVLFSEQ